MASMTRKHFKDIASEFAHLANNRDDLDRHTLIQAAKAMASVCARNNPAFDRHKFMEACGMIGT